MDNYGIQDADVDTPKGQVTILTLSFNCTLLHHPMELDIIFTRKQSFHSILHENLVLNIETPRQRKEWKKGLKTRLKYLSEGYDPHLLKVSKMGHKRCY